VGCCEGDSGMWWEASSAIGETHTFHNRHNVMQSSACRSSMLACYCGCCRNPEKSKPFIGISLNDILM